MDRSVYFEYRREKSGAVSHTVFVRVLYIFGGKYSEKIAEVPVCKPFPLRNVRRPVHLFVLPGKHPKHRDGRALHILRMDGNYCPDWRRTVILHMPILVVAGFFVLRLPIGVAGQFLLIVLISFVATFLVYEVVKRIPVLRFFLGIAERKL